MCHSVTWLYQGCHHNEPDPTAVIECYICVVTGVECELRPHERFQIPLSGICQLCAQQIRAQKEQQRERERALAAQRHVRRAPATNATYSRLLAHKQQQVMLRRRFCPHWTPYSIGPQRL